MAGNHKYIHIENDGLQVNSLNAAPEVVSRDQEGLQFHGAANYVQSFGKEHYSTVALAPDAESTADAAARVASRRRRKLLWIGGGVAAFLVVLAIILGAVLGSQAARTKQSDSQNTATTSNTSTASSSAAAAPGRVKSAEGAWNGTGLTTIFAHHPGFWAFLFYQDHAGTVQAVEHTLSNENDVGIKRSMPMNITAANGTALAGTRYNTSGTDWFHVVYVAPDNILNDVWLDGSTLDNDGVFTSSAAWHPGNLSSHSFKAPYDNRAAMFMASDPVWYGQQYNVGGARLWAGGMDGKLHQYSFDVASWSWAGEDYVFDDSNAYGGVTAHNGGSADGTFNTTVYQVGADGSLQYRVQHTGGSDSNDTAWPVGGAWESAVATSGSAAANSSLSASWQPAGGNFVFYPHADGKLAALSLDLDGEDSQEFGSYNPGVDMINIMQGTDMTQDGLFGDQFFFYQPNGSSIAWEILYSLEMRTQGILIA